MVIIQRYCTWVISFVSDRVDFLAVPHFTGEFGCHSRFHMARGLAESDLSLVNVIAKSTSENRHQRPTIEGSKRRVHLCHLQFIGELW